MLVNHVYIPISRSLLETVDISFQDPDKEKLAELLRGKTRNDIVTDAPQDLRVVQTFEESEGVLIIEVHSESFEPVSHDLIPRKIFRYKRVEKENRLFEELNLKFPFDKTFSGNELEEGLNVYVSPAFKDVFYLAGIKSVLPVSELGYKTANAVGFHFRQIGKDKYQRIPRT